MMTSWRLRSRALLAVVLVGALIIGLHALATLGLHGPTGYDRTALDAWVADPVIALATVLRWIALLMAYYLLAVIVAVAVLADNIDASPLRYVIPSRMAGSLGLLLGLTAVALPLATHIEQPLTSTETLGQNSPPVLSEIEAPPRLEQLDAEQRAPASSVSPHAAPQTPQQGAVGVDRVDSADRVWVVEPGDSFWTIAEEHLTDVWGTSDITDAEIATYWRTLIEANADRLVEAGNPDLLYPGQSLDLPEAPQQ